MKTPSCSKRKPRKMYHIEETCDFFHFTCRKSKKKKEKNDILAQECAHSMWALLFEQT